MKQGAVVLGVGVLSLGLAARMANAGFPVSATRAGERERGPYAAFRAEKRRIVTAALLPEELLVDVLEPSRWVGISYVADWAGSTLAAGRFPRTSVRTSGSAEAVLSLAPDLVILSDYNHPTTEALLQNVGVDVWRVRAVSTLPELFEEWRLLGRVVQRESQVLELVRVAEERYRKLRATVPGSTALFLQGRFAYTAQALQADCPIYAGFRNVLLGDVRGRTPQLSDEELATLEPEFVFLAAEVTVAVEATGEASLPGLPRGAFRGPETRVFLVPETLMGSISQYALNACELYVSLTHRGRP